jgi:hypothetical protein
MVLMTLPAGSELLPLSPFILRKEEVKYKVSKNKEATDYRESPGIYVRQ